MGFKAEFPYQRLPKGGGGPRGRGVVLQDKLVFFSREYGRKWVSCLHLPNFLFSSSEPMYSSTIWLREEVACLFYRVVALVVAFYF